MLAEAIAAINRAIIFRLERNLCLAAAVSADHREHLALFALSAVTVAATLVAAITATGRLVLEALLRVKFLLACAEDELLATVLARQRFVFKSLGRLTQGPNPRLMKPSRGCYTKSPMGECAPCSSAQDECKEQGEVHTAQVHDVIKVS